MKLKSLYTKHIMKSSLLAHALIVLPQQSPDIEIKNFSLIETQDNWQNLELKAELAEIYKKQDLVGIQKPNFVFWNKSGNSTKITGQKGVIESKSGDIQIQGPSEILSDGGLRFQTEVLDYSSEAQSISTQSELNGDLVNPTSGKTTMNFSGKGLEVDLKSQAYNIKSGVRATQIQDKSSFYIRSESGTIYPIQNKAQFRTNASIKTDSLNLNGDTALILMKPSSKGSSSGIDGIEMSSQGNTFVNANLGDFKIISKGFKADFLDSGELRKSNATGKAQAIGKNGIEMSAETLEMIPDEKGSYLVNLEKGVEILLDQRIAKCEFAVYNTKTGDIVLKKFASVTKGNQKLNGEIIRLSTENSEVIVEKASGTLEQNFPKKGKN